MKWFKDKKGYNRFKGTGKPVHRWAAEKKLGRPLKREEVVHHKNRDKSDNRPSNLWVFKDKEQHDRAHRYDKKKTGRW